MTRIKTLKHQLKTEADRKQTVLDPSSSRGAKMREQAVVLTVYPISTQFTCPFCLHIDNIYHFKIKTKSGYSEKRARCPECEQGMMMRSLTKEMKPEEFADWCYTYGAGFWSKVGNFEEWNRRLRKLDWSYRFWKKYKELKGEFDEESYADKMNREAIEWMKKQQEVKQ